MTTTWPDQPPHDSLTQAALDHMSEGLGVFDAQLRLVSWNRKFQDFIGLGDVTLQAGTPHETLFTHALTPKDTSLSRILARVRTTIEAASNGESHSINCELPDGRAIRFSAAPLLGGGVAAVYSNITEQNQRETDLARRVHERTAALQLSENRLNIIANEVSAGIAHVDKNMQFSYVNTRFARAYGLRPEDFIGKPCSAILAPETLGKSNHFFEQTRRGAAVDFAMTVRLPDGRDKEIRTFLRPEQPSRGEVIGFFLLSIDMTRQKAANAALLQSQKMDALGRLSSGISHDFNNLLTVILGNLTPLADRLDQPDLNEEFLAPAIAAARRGSDLTRRLLSLARRQPIDPQPVRTGDILDGLVKLLRPTIPETIEISAQSATDLPLVFVDLAQLEMALFNLAVNARDAIGASGTIELRQDVVFLSPTEAEPDRLASGHFLRLQVIDSGEGMTEDSRERIFEPFYTSKDDGAGYGLGLSMVYMFVKQSNGAIRVESKRGFGSTFTILIPAVDASDLPEADTGESPGTQLLSAQERPVTLLVDDDADVRRVLRRQLVDEGYPVIEAANAQDALDLLQHMSEIRLLISDIAMPGGMSGLDLACEVLKGPSRVGILLMTGQATPPDQSCLGVKLPILRKPFDPALLQQSIKQVLKISGEDT
ncbi:PAS-domain containing protein [Celeribacter baekdonensis]|uniref:PAS-domain containing protein n=1 Tax=Celeribacter baekdonensis TaxID=875171 RepID=UPI003A952A5F